MWEIKGVEYVYSVSRPGMGIITVRFLVGEDMEKSLVKLYNKVMSNRGMLPPGAGEPLVVPKSIDDVPILTLTLWSERYDHVALRRVAREVCDELKKSDNVAETEIKGGLARQLRVRLDAGQAGRLRAVAAAGDGCPAEGQCRASVRVTFRDGNRENLVEAGDFLGDAESVKRLVVGVHDGRPVYLADVADDPGRSRRAGQTMFFRTRSGGGSQRAISGEPCDEITRPSPFPLPSAKGPTPPGWRRIC